MKAQDGQNNGWRWHRIAQRVAKEYGATLGPTAYAVYLSLVTFADNDTGHCWPAKETIAAQWGISVRTVDAALKTLVEHNPPLVRYWRRRGKRGTYGVNEYTLQDPFRSRPAGLLSHDDDGFMGELDSERVSAQILRTDHAQILRFRAVSARSEGACEPCADSAHGDEWAGIRAELQAPADVLSMIDHAGISVKADSIVITLDTAEMVRRVEPYTGKIAGIGQNKTGVRRPVRVTLNQAPAVATGTG